MCSFAAGMRLFGLGGSSGGRGRLGRAFLALSCTLQTSACRGRWGGDRGGEGEGRGLSGVLWEGCCVWGGGWDVCFLALLCTLQTSACISTRAGGAGSDRHSIGGLVYVCGGGGVFAALPSSNKRLHGWVGGWGGALRPAAVSLSAAACCLAVLYAVTHARPHRHHTHAQTCRCPPATNPPPQQSQQLAMCDVIRTAARAHHQMTFFLRLLHPPTYYPLQTQADTCASTPDSNTHTHMRLPPHSTMCCHLLPLPYPACLHTLTCSLCPSAAAASRGVCCRLLMRGTHGTLQVRRHP